MSAPLVTPSREALAGVLALHQLHPSMNICMGCDWRATAGAGLLADQHEAHRVDTLLSSGVVRAADALAQDEALVDAIRSEAGLTRSTDLVVRCVLHALPFALADQSGGEG